MVSVIKLLIFLLDIYMWLIIGGVIVSWLVMFNVLNTRNTYVYKFCELINRLTNPVILRIRKYVPPVGNMDFSPVIVIIGIVILQSLLYSLIV